MQETKKSTIIDVRRMLYFICWYTPYLTLQRRPSSKCKLFEHPDMRFAPIHCQNLPPSNEGEPPLDFALSPLALANVQIPFYHMNGRIVMIAKWKGRGLWRELPRNPCGHLYLIGGRLSPSQSANRSMDPAPRSKFIYHEVVPTLSERCNFNRTK